MSTEQARHCAQEDETSTAAISRAPPSKRELGLYPRGWRSVKSRPIPCANLVFDS